MTKSRHSATRLRLSSLFRCLAVLCFIKLSIVAMLMLDLPLPGWFGEDRPASQHVSQEARQETAQADLKALPPALGPDTPEEIRMAVKPAPASLPSLTPQTETDGIGRNSLDASPEPQGAAAARLAANARPRPQIPPVAAAPPLTTPLLRAGVPPAPKAEEGLLDMLGLTRLPIPALGSVQTAHAAAQDMPVPSVPVGGSSPFAPAEQVSPLGGATGIAPMAPAVPGLPGNGAANMASYNASNAPGGNVPGLPRSRDITTPAPAPNITPSTALGNPDHKAEELARQQQDILILRQQMDQRLRELEEAERKMKDMISQARELEDRKVKNLIQMYANMKPRMAAKALESMDERVAVRILSGMAPKQSGEILTYTNPAKTAKFTELITRMRMPD